LGPHGSVSVPTTQLATIDNWISGIWF
jgi:hypothetical protein